MTTRSEIVRRRGAVVSFVALVLGVLLLGAVAVSVLVADHPQTRPPRGPAAPPPVPVEPGWDVAAETALAQRPMLSLPVQDALPQPLAAAPPPEAINVPAPTDTQGVWIPQGFPPTPEGAVGQLQALTEQALIGADPAVVDRAYRAVSEPEAPDPSTSTPYRAAASLRSAANLPDVGAVPGLSAGYQVNEAEIKGVADGGRFAVVCVLGVVSADHQTRSGQAGLGVCEAMRYVGGQWRIAAIPRAAAATSVWPGSDAAIRAGYRELRHAS